jgi:hypothetical protein
MSLNAGEKQLLRATLKRRSRTELKALFAAIRRNDDRMLLAVLAPAQKKPRRPIDPLVRDLETALRPVLATAAEKAGMLIDHLSKKHGCSLAVDAKSLADAARLLRGVKLSDDQIRAGAQAMVAHLARLHGRETVV